jgi:hypothetical protein
MPVGCQGSSAWSSAHAPPPVAVSIQASSVACQCGQPPSRDRYGGSAGRSPSHQGSWAVILVVIPPGTTAQDGERPDGQNNRPDQEGRNPARRCGRSWADFLIRKVQVRVLPGTQGCRPEAWKACPRDGAGHAGHSFATDRAMITGSTHQAWGATSQSCGLLGLPADAGAEQARLVVAEVVKRWGNQLLFAVSGRRPGW